jgi:hypothetical protein
MPARSLMVAFPVRVVAFPAPDVPGEWLIQSLDTDIMAQGLSPNDALERLCPALIEMIAFRLSKGMSPIEWSRAPEEYWLAAEAALGRTIDRAHPTNVEFVSSDSYPLPTTMNIMAVTDRAPDLVAHAS